VFLGCQVGGIHQAADRLGAPGKDVEMRPQRRDAALIQVVIANQPGMAACSSRLAVVSNSGNISPSLEHADDSRS
jgi:hypothetical protein